MGINQWLLIIAVAIIDIIAIYWVFKTFFARKPEQKPIPCSKCTESGIERESEFVREGQWLCSAHYNEVLLQDEKMLEESRRQHRDAILDGGVWTQRLLRRQERLSDLSRRAGR